MHDAVDFGVEAIVQDEGFNPQMQATAVECVNFRDEAPQQVSGFFVRWMFFVRSSRHSAIPSIRNRRASRSDANGHLLGIGVLLVRPLRGRSRFENAEHDIQGPTSDQDQLFLFVQRSNLPFRIAAGALVSTGHC